MLQEKLLSFALVGEVYVLYLLIGLSVLCLGIAVERVVFGAMNRTSAALLEPLLTRVLQGGSLPEAADELDRLKGVEARVLGAGLRAGVDGGAEAAEEAIAGTLSIERLKLERGLIVLGTTGSNAPFVGLFGTVLGIMKAFKELAQNEAEAASAVMVGISQALVATAAGLFVAIPAVVMYNVFQRRNKELLTRVESLSHLMLSRLKSRPGAAAGAGEGT